MATQTIKIGLTTDSGIDPNLLRWVSDALNVQLSKEFLSDWGIAATVAPYASQADVPAGVWPVVVTNNLNDPSALGVHMNQSDGTPFAQILNGPNWSLTASHEIVEMLVDPQGSRFFDGQSPMPGQGIVEFLAEPCDPVEEMCRKVGPFLVSDFILPHYYDGQQPLNQGKYVDAYGHSTKALQLLDGGYISWRRKGTHHWFQAFMVGGRLSFSDLGIITAQKGKRFQELVDEARDRAKCKGSKYYWKNVFQHVILHLPHFPHIRIPR